MSVHEVVPKLMTHNKAPSLTNGWKNGSVSDAVFAEPEMTSLYADNLAFQFLVCTSIVSNFLPPFASAFSQH